MTTGTGSVERDGETTRRRTRHRRRRGTCAFCGRRVDDTVPSWWKGDWVVITKSPDWCIGICKRCTPSLNTAIRGLRTCTEGAER